MTETMLFPTDLAGPAQVAESPPLPAGRALGLEAAAMRTTLTRRRRGPDGRSRWCDWSVHPYRGCETGCGDGDAWQHDVPLSAFLGGHDGAGQLEHSVHVERGFARALREDLRRRVRPGAHVAFGTATDPYPPLERRERVTRAALREIARAEGLRVSITTRATLVTRDVDVLRRLAGRHALHVNMTVPTADRRLARLLEPRAPEPAARLRAVRALRRAGISGGLFVPLLPGVTDSDADLVALLRAARDAGAQWVGSRVVFLREPSGSVFLRRLRGRYPRVAARYEVWTRYRSRRPGKVRDESLDRLRGHARRLGLPCGARCELPAPARPRQATFGFAREVP